ncbi:MAG: Sensor histidine kinase [Myxococcales bacterium]|nr:Sensor histidine kinase [Myxococcales bacterium]
MSESLLRHLEDAPAAIAVQRGPELRYELANRLYGRLLGGAELMGRALAEVLPDWAQLRRILEAVQRDGHPFIGREHRFLVDRLGDGELRDAYFDVICQPLREGDAIVGVLTFAVDVTTQVEARQRMESVAAELQRAVEARDEFLSVASHELKTPLTALRLQVQSLQRSVHRAPEAQYSAEQLRAKFDAADRQVNRLVELIDALLDVSRVQAGHMDVNLEEIDLAAVVTEVVERGRTPAAATGSILKLDAATPVVGRWDRSRVDQVITNLVSNAIKYGGGKPIDVRVYVESFSDGDNQGRRAAASVTDHGIGIAPADQARIFERFERAVSRTSYAGLGLGLWISRQIAETLGGTIIVESAPGAGARFTLFLPL